MSLSAITSLKAILATMVLSAFAAFAFGQSSPGITTLATFTYGGSSPFRPGALIEGPDGNFYGTTSQGGNTGANGATLGTFFQVTPQGTLTILHSFTQEEGGYPSGVVLGPDGNLYGALSGYGAYGGGSVYQFTPSGNFTVLRSFTGGTDSTLVGPQPSSLTVGPDGNLYGFSGGGVNNCGAIFRLTPAGVATLVHSFPLVRGGFYSGGYPMVVAKDGTFYGVSDEGIFHLTTSGQYTLIPGPVEGYLTVTPGSDGNLYGTTQTTVFKLTPQGTFTTLYVTPSTPFSEVPLFNYPSPLIDGGDGFFYGNTANSGQGGINTGEIFKVSPAGTFVIAAYPLDSNQVGYASPYVLGTDGYLYGAGMYTVYRFDRNAPSAPVITSFSASPETIPPGDFTTITWSTINSTGCTESGSWNGVVLSSGSEKVTPTVDGEGYALTCTGPGGSAMSAATVYLMNPPFASISVSPTTVNIGQSATLEWNGQYTCSASGAWSGNVTAPSYTVLTPSSSGNFVYTLSCLGYEGFGSATASATLTVNPLPTVTVAANPAVIWLGQSSTLSWSSVNASSCKVTGAANTGIALSGTYRFTPSVAGQFSYLVSCSGPTGTGQNTLTLTVRKEHHH
jgi:uncharacterized repeat protein (TIGR03803 family)